MTDMIIPATGQVSMSTLNSAALGARRFSELPDRIQFAYTLRFISAAVNANPGVYNLMAGQDVVPQPGDVVIARVGAIRNHKRIETEVSRKAILFEGAIVGLAYGHRYAVDQFLAHVPDSLVPCHLVAAGGIAGTVTEVHSKLAGPTDIEPLGLLVRDGKVVNLLDHAPLVNHPVAAPRPKHARVIAVLGTSMNSGKSTVLACAVNGLTKAGYRIGAGKITGTGAGNDTTLYWDAGAHEVVDFTHYGYGTTFRQDFESLRSLAVNMIDQLSQNNDVVIVEIADGVYQEETARLLRDEIFQASVDSVMFASVDALGARAGVSTLIDAGHKVSCASGVVTSAPLATREAQQVLNEYGVPVVDTFDLKDSSVASGLLAEAAGAESAAAGTWRA